MPDEPAQQKGRQGQGRTGETRGPENAGTAREQLLEDQQLSTERQRAGKGWSELPPGESQGTTPRPPGNLEGGQPETASGTPPAGKAEQEGQRRDRQR
jgi:hypothetical protein